MEKLNELVELAKKATPGRNHDRLDSCGGGIKYQCLGDDGSLVLQCDHKNDEYGFIGPKSMEDEAFFLACKPEIILAIAEAYSVLERRVETAESEVQRFNATAQPVSDGWVKCSERMPDEENYYLTYSNAGVDVTYFDGEIFSDEYASHWMPLPAAPGGQCG